MMKKAKGFLKVLINLIVEKYSQKVEKYLNIKMNFLL